MGKKNSALGQLLMGGLAFINGMNSSWTRASAADRDKFPDWFKSMKGNKPDAPAASKVEAPSQNTSSAPAHVDPPEPADTPDAPRAVEPAAPDVSGDTAVADTGVHDLAGPPDTPVGGASDAGYAAAWDSMPEVPVTAPAAAGVV